MLTVYTFGGKLIVLPNHDTDMMYQNTFSGKMIISLVSIMILPLSQRLIDRDVFCLKMKFSIFLFTRNGS